MRYLIFISILLFVCIDLTSQEVIDGSFVIQKENKKYSIYVPSSYDAGAAQSLMIGFHPLNTNRWDAESWRDTLIQFAETNQLLLACPDGGPDGRVDDPIDTTFTTALIDSVQTWYNVDQSNQYAIGFSWGARTAYSYSMNHPGVFKGVIPIGAAIDGTDQFAEVLSNASDMAFYIVHGSNDSPAVRYTPVLNAFNQREVCYGTQLLAGVGHTIDFPNRNAIISEAFAFVKDDLACQTSSSGSALKHSSIKVYPNPISDQMIRIADLGDNQVLRYELFDNTGRLIYEYSGTLTELRTNNIANGVYIMKILHKDGQYETRKLIFED